MRKYWNSAHDFDHSLRNFFVMNKHDLKIKESHAVWEHFQHKITTINCKSSFIIKSRILERQKFLQTNLV